MASLSNFTQVLGGFFIYGLLGTAEGCLEVSIAKLSFIEKCTGKVDRPAWICANLLGALPYYIMHESVVYLKNSQALSPQAQKTADWCEYLGLATITAAVAYFGFSSGRIGIVGSSVIVVKGVLALLAYP